MIFSYDAFNRLDRPITYLAKPNKKYIGTIQSKELVTDLCFNNISETKFKVNKYENRELTFHYDEIELLKLVEVSHIGWFKITDINTVGNGENEYKEVTALSLENELTTKILTSFGSMGIESDETGGLDRYCLYNIADTDHSILHIVLEKAPTWKVGFIDPEITTEYRGFNNDSVDAYSFLVGDVSKEFGCIFQFDSFEKSISAYKLENIGQLTSIYLSYRNLIKQIDIQSNATDIKTIMNIAGGDDRGTPLGIIEVNPNGNNYISNFSYYKPWMSQELQDKLDAYETEYESRVNNFTPAIDVLQDLYEELSYIKNQVPSVEHSTDWDEYGLVELQTEYDYYKQKMSLYLDGQNESLRLQYKNLCDTINAKIKIRQSEYNNKLTQIENQKTLCESLVLDLPTYLGTELYNELSVYAHYTDFVDDTFVVTDIMTDEEILQMKRDLLNMAHTELAKVCKPSYTMNVDSINFTTIPDFIKYSEQMYLGNILTVEYDNDITVESRLLKMHIEWDNLKNFKLTFSSKNRLDEGWAEFAEIQQQANNSSRSQTINGTGWNNAKNQTNEVKQYMKSALDTSLQKLKSGNNEQFLIDATGTMWKKWDDATNDFSPRQMWGVGNGLFLTENNWQTVSLAIGELDLGNGIVKYGIAAPLLMGNMVLTESLQISNENNSISMDGNGAVFTNCDITINKGTSSLKLNATDGIKLTNNGTSQFYLDASGNATFAGKISGGSININNKFIVDSNGNLTAKNGKFTDGDFSGDITGGSININDNFKVTSAGNLTANNANLTNGTFTGSITGGSININNKFTVNGNGDFFAETATFGGDTYRVKTNNDGISVIDVSTGSAVSRLWANSVYGDYVLCDHLSVETFSGITANGRGLSYYLATKNHDHESTEIDAVLTSGENIAFGGKNAASVTWVNDNFQRISASDFRLKKNIQTLNLPDELFMSIKTKQFEFKVSDYGQGINFGVLSQELESSFQQLGLNPYDYNLIELGDVRTYTDEGFYVDDYIHRVNYNNFIPWLINVVQKQQTKIDVQQGEIDGQREKINLLENKVNNFTI